ncbi:polyketide synthase [Sparassis latifolia]
MYFYRAEGGCSSLLILAMGAATHCTEIAIVGIAAELPGGSKSAKNLDYKAFSEFLLQKGEAYETIPLERFNIQGLRGQGVGKVLTDTGAFLKDVHLFDYLEFGMTSRDARLMPLSTRKLIELAFLSLLDSGIDYRGHNIGCYVAGVAHDMFAISGHDDYEARGTFVYGPAMVANRVSYHLDLRGPSIPIDTACSSSLYATHLAVQALRNGECEAAVVGGCQINHRFAEWLIYSEGGVLAPDGKCKPFDASANGFGRGEGAVSIVLKPLDAALRDHDNIYGTILGTGVNSSGSQAPANAPVAAAQQDAMLRAFVQAQRLPQEVDFIELHATGTAQGDPAEANWVGAQFQRGEELIIGSVKGNIGHLEITAFLASLCKVCSMFQTRLIPPTVNLDTPNPSIRWDEYRLRAPTEVEPLPCGGASGRSLVALASSGIGGANAHCVVQGPPLQNSHVSSFWSNDDVPALFVAGGLSPRSTTALYEELQECDILENVQYLSRIYGRRSRSMNWRSFAVAHGGRLSSFSKARMVPKSTPPLVFVFSGQGPQHLNMGRELFKTCSVFSQSVAEMDEIYRSVLGHSLLETTGLFADHVGNQPLGDIWPIAVTLPALTILQIALVDALASLGIRPNVVIGHSAGETAVLYASGSGSKAMAVELAIARGRAMSLLEDAHGTMAALSCSPSEAAQIIQVVAAELGSAAVLEIGCYNTPSAVTLSGAEDAIDLAVKKAEAFGFLARRLRTRIPVHSALMALCQKQYEEYVHDVFLRYNTSKPTVETYSTKTGDLFNTPFDAQYFWDGTRGPVMFTDAMQASLSQNPNSTFIEISPHPVLSSYISSMAGKDSTVLCPLRRPKRTEHSVETLGLVDSLGRLIVAGHNCVNFDVLCHATGDVDETVPPYPFARKDIPYRAQTAEVTRLRQSRNGPLNYPQLQVNAKTHPGLAEHVIKGEPIMPAAGYLEMALEFGAKKLLNVEFISFLALSSEHPTPVHVKLEGSHWTVSSASSADFTKSWPPQYNRLHAKGYLSMNASAGEHRDPVPLDYIRERLQPVEMNGFYDGFKTFADYGPTYQRILACNMGTDENGRDEVLVQVRGADHDIPDLSEYHIHPAILDCALHVVVHPLITGSRDKGRYYLPSKVGTLIIHDALQKKSFPRMIYAHAVLHKWLPDSLIWNVSIVDEEGTHLCTLEKLEVALHGQSRKAVQKRYDVVYQQAGISVAGRRYKSNDPRLSADVVSPLARVAGIYGLASSVAMVSRFFFPFRSVRQLLFPSASECVARIPTSGSWSSHTEDDSHKQESVSDTASVSSSAGDEHASSASTLGGESSPVVIDFVRGKEIRIQKLVASLDPLAEHSLWFLATMGLDGDASLGFTRSLRKEYRVWIIRVVVFDSAWTDLIERRNVMHDLMDVPDCELELMVDAHGSVLVPRIAPTSPPPTVAVFRPHLPWMMQTSGLEQISLPPVPDEHVLVRIVSVVQGAGPLWSFVGQTDDRSSAVVGLAGGSPSNIIVAHRGSLVERAIPRGNLGPCVLASVIAVLALGISSFTHRERLQQSSILVTDADTTLGSQVAQIYTALRLHVSTLPAHCIADMMQFSEHPPKIVVSGTEDVSEIRALQDLVGSHGKLFLWNHRVEGIARILATDPWSIGDALRCAFKEGAKHREPFQRIADLAHPYASMQVPLVSSLFDHAKSYLLVGGVGSLGLRIALWMYQNGAREIILTSRSGRKSVTSRSESVARHILNYLESLPDLVLRVEAADAQSTPRMMRVVKDMQNPLAGCMLLAGALVDRSFASQTQETFETPFTPKVGAFKALEKTIPIASLDFLVAFSSVSGMFGNAGQTNYASANTALAGLTKKYRNAFTLVTPAIIDSYFALSAEAASKHGLLKHLSDWGMTGWDFCEYIGDGIRQLREGPVWQYIPDFDWRLVWDNMGPSTMYAQLVPDNVADSTEVQPEDAAVSLRNVVCKVLDVAPQDLSRDMPFTSYGLDSLSAASLSYALRPVLAVSQIQLLADLTLGQLEDRWKETTEDAIANGVDGVQDMQKETNKSREMLKFVERYTTNLLQLSSISPLFVSDMKNILITGTTGSLGAHMLAHLLQAAFPLKVYALLRKGPQGVSTAARQRKAFEMRGLDVTLLKDGRLVLLEGDLVAPSLGLSDVLFETVVESLTHIVHLGWPINFNGPLTMYEAAIQGLRALVDTSSKHRSASPAKLIFTSSISMIRNLPYSHLVCEEPLLDPMIALDSGYPESKWVAERILGLALEKGLRTTVVRVGQLSGGANGAWKTAEWFPAMISASVALGCLPMASGNISWLPVDVAARALIDMLDTAQSVLHLRHPTPMSISTVVPLFSECLGLPIVSYAEWFSRLKAGLARRETEAKGLAGLEPAMRLMNVFELSMQACSSQDSAEEGSREDFGLTCSVDVTEGLAASATLREAASTQIGREDVERWLNWWRDVGFLPAKAN